MIWNMEWVTGIEPASPAWKAGALPLSYTHMLQTGKSLCFHAAQRIYMPLIYLIVCRSSRPTAGQKNGVPMPSDDRRGCMKYELVVFSRRLFLLSRPGWLFIFPVFPGCQIEFARLLVLVAGHGFEP